MNVVYCEKGHYIGSYNVGGRTWSAVVAAHAGEERDDAPHRASFCAQCGSKSVSACECGAPIRALNRVGGRPSYCYQCAKPYPWTSEALAAAKEYTDELESISAEEKASLKTTLDELTVESPRTPLAVSRFKRWLDRIGPVAGPFLTKIVVQFADEATKKMLGM